MTVGQKTVFLWFSGGFLLVSAALGLTPNSFASPYQGIVDRNVFGLKPMPPAVRPEDIKPPAPDLNLTGITTILGNKRALLKVPAKPPKQKEESYILTEGQSEGDIEVLTIDEVAGTVKVMNHGVAQTLDFSINTKGGVGSAGPTAMGSPATAQGSVPPALGSAFRQIPPRPMRGPNDQVAPASTAATPPALQNQNQASTPNYAAGANYSGQNQGNNGNANLSFNSSASQSMRLEDSPQFTHGLSGDQQMLLIEAQRAKLLDQGNIEEANMYPPTDLSPQ